MASKYQEFADSIAKLKYEVENDFVCINDLLDYGGYVYGLNPVVYNRQLSPEANKMSVYSLIYQRFRVSLTPDQLSILCDHNLTSVEFIRQLKTMI